MFEPIGGTAPDHAGKETINPLAAIGAVGMLLSQLGEADAAARVDAGIRRRLPKMKSMRAGEMGFSTAEVGDLVVEGRPGPRRGPATATAGIAGRALRHHAAGRRPAGRPLVLDRGPAPNPAQARPGRLPLHRRRVAGGEPARYGVLQARRQGDARERPADLVRNDPPGGRAGGGLTVLRELLDTGTEVVCLVGKSWDLHVTDALRTTLDEGVAMVRDSVAFLPVAGPPGVLRCRALLRRLRADSAFASAVLAAAEEAGAERLVLCDTNGGMLPHDVARIVDDVPTRRARRPSASTCTTTRAARSRTRLVAVEAGVFQVQGIVNGYGERTGNADLVPIAANLSLKMGADACPRARVEHLTELAHYVAEVANVAPDSRQPYAGRFAFTHKAGCTRAASPGCREPTSTSRPQSSATGAAWSPPTSAVPRPSR